MSGPVRVTIVGWTDCGFYQRASQALKTAVRNSPGQYILHNIELESREKYQRWLAEEKPKIQLNKGGKHTSSPLVWLNDNEYLGGCDATIAYLSKKVDGNDKKSVSGKKRMLQTMGFFGAANAPLLITSVSSLPLLTGSGVLLSVWLLQQTITPPPPLTEINKAQEHKALNSLVITSSTNRLTRAAIGCIHVYAALAMANRWNKLDAVFSWLDQGKEMMGLLSLCTLGAVWLSSAYYGQ